MASLALAAAAGCGGGTHDAVVAITTVDWDSGTAARAIADAVANGHEAPLSAVLPVVPTPLPANDPQASNCERRTTVEVTFASGRVASYGPCTLPLQILFLRSAVVGESNQWSSPAVTHTTVGDGLPAERQLLRRLLRAFRPKRITYVRIGPLTGEPGWQSWRLPARDVVVHVDAGGSMRDQWEARLLAARYIAEARRLHLRPVGLIETDGNNGGGRAQDIRFQPSTADSRQLHRRARQAGVRIMELRRPFGALALTVRANNPAAFLKHHGRQFLEAVSGGWRYIAVEDANGSIVYAVESWGNGGGFFARPDLYACAVSGPRDASQRLPCPA